MSTTGLSAEDPPSGAARTPESQGAARPASDFAALSQRIQQAGLLRRRPGYYAARGSVLAVLFAAGWAAFFLLGDSWWQMAVAVYLAVVFGQFGLFAHDLAHRQVFRTRAPSEAAGRIAGNLAIGMGYGWWQDKHTRHHANPNHEDLDPDVAPDLLVWSHEQAENASGPARFIGRWQAVLFYPLLTLEGMNLHVQSVISLFRPRMRLRWLEAVLLGTHFVLYLGALFTVLSPGRAVLFLVIHQALFGIYLGCIFAPNHKGMPTLTAGDKPDFLRKQVLTSRNVTGGVVTDVALGGLNYQIEHHLFPSMPSPHLSRARLIVRDFCAEIGLSYHETGFLRSHGEALAHMHHAGEPLRRPRRAAATPQG
ncbi:fatty acid desaturase family protein [Streptomonospora sediminis]